MPEKPQGLIEQLLENQKELTRRMADIALDNRLKQEWYLDAECARLKGISAAYLSLHRWARPRGGKGKKRVAGRMRTHRSAVKEWLDQADEQLLELYGKAKDKQEYFRRDLPAAAPFSHARRAG